MANDAQQNKNEDKDRSFLYRLTLLAAVIQPLTTVPQVIKIYSTHNIGGLSLFTWVSYAVIGLVFLAYGIKYRLWPIALTQIIWFCLQMSIVVGILLYR
jgi:uncharacterized protein with PQ loop repeat